MDDRVLGAVGGMAGLALLRRVARPAARLGMRGVVAVVDATSGARRGLADLYAEARREQRAGGGAGNGAHADAPTGQGGGLR